MRFVIVFCVIAAAWVLPNPTDAQTRHALVIGIDDYAYVDPLQKARNDARAVHGALEAAGFEADLMLDSDGMALLQGLERFASRIQPGDEAVFFFAGHGVELDGENILLPADIPAPETGGDLLVRRFGIPVAAVLEQIQRRGARLSLLILDACRDNPFPRQGTRSLGGTRGLAEMQAPEGAYIMYSAGTGQAALDRLSNNDPDPNSIFTRALLPRLTTPGLRLRDVVREVRSEVRQLASTVGHNQFPAVYDQLDGEFIFVPVALTPNQSPGRAVDGCTAAAAVWPSVEASDSIDALKSFNDIYGESCPVLAALAEDRIETLSRADDSEPETVPETATRMKVRPDGALNARAGPGTDNDIVETLAASTELREIQRSGEWSRVALPDNRIAWVHNGFIMTPDEHERQIGNVLASETEAVDWSNPQLARQLGLADAVFMPDGASIIGQRPSDNALVIRDTVTGRRQLQFIPLGQPGFKPLQIDPTGRRILVTQKRALQVITMPEHGTASMVRHHRLENAAFEAARFSPDGQTIAVTGYLAAEGTVLLDANSLEVRRQLDDGRNDVGFSPDGRQLVVTEQRDAAHTSDGVRVIDASSGRLVTRVIDPATGRGVDGALQARFSPDGRRLAIASRDYNVYLANTANGHIQRRFSGHQLWVEATNFSPDSSLLVSAAHDGTARIWDAETGVQIALLSHQGRAVVHATFSPDGRRLITCALDDDCYLWEAN